MPYTVIHPGGTKDAEFQFYIRLLRQKGIDIGKLERVRDPITKNRYLYVWKSEEEAQAFADELRELTKDAAWQVRQVDAQPSEGPLGPLVIQLVRQADGLTFGLHPLSRAMIRSAFPQAVSSTTSATIDTAAWYDFKKTGGLSDLVREVAPSLTGLSREELEEVGYLVLDADTDDTLVMVPPAVAAQLP